MNTVLAKGMEVFRVIETWRLLSVLYELISMQQTFPLAFQSCNSLTLELLVCFMPAVSFSLTPLLSRPLLLMQPASSSNLPLAWNGCGGQCQLQKAQRAFFFSFFFFRKTCCGSVWPTCFLTVTLIQGMWLTGKGEKVHLPSQPFHCEAGSGLILPLAAAVWKTSDFVVFS